MRQIFLLILLCVFLDLSSQNQVKFGEMDIPIRMRRTLGLSANIGWNSLTGIGATFQYYIVPKVALDAGVGLSSVGYKFSARGRYLFTKKNFTPFVGAGFIYGTGTSGQEFAVEDIETGQEIWLTLSPSRFIQIVGGAEYIAKSGFFLMFDAGVAVLLSDNINVTNGNPTEEMMSVMRFSYGTGIVMEVSIGYIFGGKKGYSGKY